MENSIRFLSTLICALLLAGTVMLPPSADGAQGKLVITGTGSAIGVMRLMAKAYQERHRDVAVEILPSIGSTGGIKAVIDRKIDIGLSSRPLKPEERIPGLVEEVYGRTGFIFGAQVTNPEKGFTLKEIEEVFAGKRTTWHDGKPLRLVLRPKSDAYSVYLASITPGLKAANEKSHAIPGLFVGGTDQDAVAQIEKTQGAFGITSACIVASEERKIKGLAVNGVAPTVSNVSSGAYPYSMTMHTIYRKDTSNPSLKPFVDFIFSAQGQKILTQTDHVPLKRTLGR